jgi:thiamine pyrophosphate-dependent acetolactate synthase large subunit-like protein
MTGRAYTAVVDGLAALGVTAAFGLMGEDTAELITDLERVGIPFHAARHENVAVNMADAYAWASGGLGVCVLSRGPGATNATTALATAVLQSRALLVLSGEAAVGGSGADPKAKISQCDLAALTGLEYHTADTPAAVGAALFSAAATARTGRPAWLALPIDVLHAQLDGAPAATPPAAAPDPAPAEPAPEAVQDAASRLADARLPLLLAGRGAVAAGAREALQQLAGRGGALLGTTLLAKDLFRDHTHDLGIVGSFSSAPARALLDEVDLVLVFGASLTIFTRAGGRLLGDVATIHFDTDPALGVHADARLAAEGLLAALPAATAELDARTRERLAASRRPEAEDLSGPEAIDPRALTVALDLLLPRERAVVSDGGHCLGFPAMHVHVPEPQAYLLPQGMHAIGMGLGAALGVALARPDRQTVCFIGDGSLAMTMGDLETVARLGVPLLIVVLNDHAYGAERHLLDLAGHPHHRSQFPDTDFAAVGAGLGMVAATIRTAADLARHASTLAAPLDEPMLLDCKIMPELRATWMEELV